MTLGKIWSYRLKKVYSFTLILAASSCLDRISFDIKKPSIKGIVVSGFISDQPGPYEVQVTTAFDTESIESQRNYVTAKRIAISDNLGNSEDLENRELGVYQTKPNGIQGVAGGVYTLRVELYDGRIYESLPDTITAGGKLDSLYIKYSEVLNYAGSKIYNADIYFNSSYNPKINDRFIWKFTGTFKAETQPELYPPGTGECFYLDEVQGCNFIPPCSGLRNIARPAYPPQYKRTEECGCCICWYNLFNPFPVLSDKLLLARGELNDIKIHTIPLNQWTLSPKIRLEVSQRSLSKRAFRFYKAIKDQQDAVGSLFQPITGKIPSNFKQLEGTPSPINGLFFATSISSKEKYLDRYDLPPEIRFEISTDRPIFTDDCRKLFPNNSLIKPSFWID